MANEAYIDLDRLTLYDTQLKTYDSTVVQMDGTASAGTSKRAARADHVHPTDTSRAPLASPAFSGTPTAPTASTATDNTQIATTAFVHAAITASGGEANQNAFSNVKVGNTTIAADTETDTLTLTAGSNVTLTPNATSDTVTIAATDTTYSDFTGATASAAGTHGLVPAPAAGDDIDLLQGNGSWVNPKAALAEAMQKATDNQGFVTWKVSGDTPIVEGARLPLTAANGGTGVSTASANQVFAGPSSGSAAAPGFRALVAADIPNLNTSKLTAGTLGVARGGTGVSTLGAGVVYHSASGTGALSIATAANLVSAIGNSAVARATGDADGNAISSTYLKSATASSTYLTQTAAESTYAKKTDVSGIYKYQGSVATASALPASPATGDVYNIEAESTYGPAGTNVAWTGTAWDSLGGIFTISTATNAQIEALFA